MNNGQAWDLKGLEAPSDMAIWSCRYEKLEIEVITHAVEASQGPCEPVLSLVFALVEGIGNADYLASILIP